MLMLFHLINILIIRYLRNKRLLEEENFVGNSETMINTAIETTEIDHEDLENNISFDPPLYRQRYGRVYEILIDERWRTKVSKLCDFGCAELGLFIFAKRANKITQMLFVDIDENLLNEKSFKVKPLLVDYVQRRNEPLEISLLAGSIADPDYRISNVDVISAVEVIEHLYPDTLDEFPYNIFNFVEPKIVVVTTPNADFNVLFPDKLTKFRHYDHKFEWTREQFEDWADNITKRYPDYIVKFEGLGEGPEGSLHLGHCTQLALFIRKDLLDNNYVLRKYSLPCTCYDKSQCPTCKCTCPCCIPIKSYGTCTFHTHSKIINLNSSDDQNPNTFYNLVESIEYPYEPDTRSEEEKLIQEFIYRINTFNHHNSRFFVRERDRVEIPISDILYGNKFAAITEKELCDLLEKHEYQIERCHVQETDEFEKCIIVTPLMDDFTSSSDQSELDDTISGYFQPVNESVSDWDDDHMDQKNEKVEDSTKGEYVCKAFAS